MRGILDLIPQPDEFRGQLQHHHHHLLLCLDEHHRGTLALTNAVVQDP